MGQQQSSPALVMGLLHASQAPKAGILVIAILASGTQAGKTGCIEHTPNPSI